ncbi:MAG: hypothetical protein AB1631_03945 [Acidobacteriota bacterium]
MSKLPEEGEIWEWRAFGRIDDQLAARVRTRPVRMNILDQQEEDIYFISPANDQNVKLRKWRGMWLLKLKLFLGKGTDSIELYSESPRMMFAFPVPRQTLAIAARLLAVNPAVTEEFSFEKDQFIEAMERALPPALVVLVSKVRSQFEFDGGWVELAEAKFPRIETETISIHSPSMEAVEKIIDELDVPPSLEVMNYVEACRRWG